MAAGGGGVGIDGGVLDSRDDSFAVSMDGRGGTDDGRGAGWVGVVAGFPADSWLLRSGRALGGFGNSAV